MVKVKQGESKEQMTAIYTELVKKAEPKPPRLRNALYAFFVGGFVCLVGEGITDFWEAVMDVSHKRAGDATVATMILIGALLTGFGLFDKLAIRAGAGLAVPVTGFANAMTASAMEFKREGLIYGVGSKMFMLAGSVIVYGVVTAFLVGIVASLYQMFF